MFYTGPRGHQWLAATLAALFVVPTVTAKCSANLVIDDFSKLGSSQNSLGKFVNDDGTMKNISAMQNVLSLVPVRPTANQLSTSYFYEVLPCITANTDGYTGVSFTVKAPAAGASLTLELQTLASCGVSSNHPSQSWHVVNSLSIVPQRVTVPLTGWSAESNLDGLTSLVWATWTSPSTDADPSQAGVWQISDIELECGNNGSPVLPPVISSTSSMGLGISSTFKTSTTASGITTTTKRPIDVTTSFVKASTSSTKPTTTSSTSPAKTTTPTQPGKTPSRPKFCFFIFCW
ncbi:hypothetical protein GQ53DRAFT_815412 [Thozetella sp. PMI_491]|nr:hypothetical protein GQ53DRAFT_815412 [Thozetella sp. PMI_491]